MRRHAFDALSFTFGALFLAVAAAGLTGPWSVRDLDLAWLGPAVLVLLGVVVLLTALTPRSGRGEVDQTTPAGTEGEGDISPGDRDEDATEPR